MPFIEKGAGRFASVDLSVCQSVDQALSTQYLKNRHQTCYPSFPKE